MIPYLAPNTSTKQPLTPFGVLVVNKPLNWTSHDVVAKVRGLSKIKKTGHSGTLDPLATGVLPVYFDAAGRLIEFMPDDKSYEADITFGKQTTSWDGEGEVINDLKAPNLTQEQIEKALEQFKGTIQQTVPPHSAVKVAGKKLYLYARKGQAVELPVRAAEIFEIKLLSFTPHPEYPMARVSIHCGSGTYIRSIAKELGDTLTVGAYMSGLVRTTHGKFGIHESITIEALEKLEFEEWPLLNPLPYLPLPKVELSNESLQKVIYGQKLQQEDYGTTHVKNTQLALVYQNDIVAIATVEEKGRLDLNKVFRIKYFQNKLN